MAVISVLGEPLVLIAIGVIGYLWATLHHQTAIRKAFIYAGIAFGLCVLLKLVLHKARPHNLDIRTFGIRSYSFPSGHAFGTVIFYGLLSYLALRYLVQPWGVIIFLLIWPLVAGIGISRIYLKAHYPSDVAGGWLLGLFSLIVVVKLAF